MERIQQTASFCAKRGPESLQILQQKQRAKPRPLFDFLLPSGSLHHELLAAIQQQQQQQRQ